MEKGASKEGRKGGKDGKKTFAFSAFGCSRSLLPPSQHAFYPCLSIYQAGEQNGNVIEIH